MDRCVLYFVEIDVEIRKGTEITPAKLRSLLTKIFQKINEIDPTAISFTTGQIIDHNEPRTLESDALSIYGDQYFKSDTMLNQYATEDVSYLQRYIDELNELEEGE